jgi:hypothetical protein
VGVTFKYPAFFGFEADVSDPTVKIWSLDGNDLVIMVQHYLHLEMSAKTMSDQLISYFGDAAVAEPQKISRTFNGKNYDGYRVTADFGGSIIYKDVLGIPAKKGSRLLIVQDMPADQKVSEEETETVTRLLNESLVISEIDS